MDLILWRHAEAEEALEGQSDSERKLTSKGKVQAARMAEWLLPRLPPATRMLVSPARRTRETAARLGVLATVMPELALSEPPEPALRLTGWPGGETSCLLVGHQPMLGQIAARLLGSRQPDWAIRKGAVWWFIRREREGLTETILRAVINPKDL